jgi:hypothetical protein
MRAPLISPKRSGRHAVRLPRDGITVRPSFSFNFLTIRAKRLPAGQVSYIGELNWLSCGAEPGAMPSTRQREAL